MAAFNEGGESAWSNIAPVSTAQKGKLEVKPNPVKFKPVRATKSTTALLTLKNIGLSPVIVSISTPNPPFSLLTAVSSVRLQPGESKAVTLQFKPPARGKYTGQLTVASEDALNPIIPVGLEGTGTGK